MEPMRGVGLSKSAIDDAARLPKGYEVCVVIRLSGVVVRFEGLDVPWVGSVPFSKCLDATVSRAVDAICLLREAKQ